MDGAIPHPSTPPAQGDVNQDTQPCVLYKHTHLSAYTLMTPKIDVLRRLVERFKVLEEFKATQGTKTEKDYKVPYHFEVFLKYGMLRGLRGDGRLNKPSPERQNDESLLSLHKS